MNDDQRDEPSNDKPEVDKPCEAEPQPPKIRKITIKTAVRAAGQSHNRYGFTNGTA